MTCRRETEVPQPPLPATPLIVLSKNSRRCSWAEPQHEIHDHVHRGGSLRPGAWLVTCLCVLPVAREPPPHQPCLPPSALPLRSLRARCTATGHATPVRAISAAYRAAPPVHPHPVPTGAQPKQTPRRTRRATLAQMSASRVEHLWSAQITMLRDGSMCEPPAAYRSAFCTTLARTLPQFVQARQAQRGPRVGVPWNQTLTASESCA